MERLRFTWMPEGLVISLRQAAFFLHPARTRHFPYRVEEYRGHRENDSQRSQSSAAGGAYGFHTDAQPEISKQLGAIYRAQHCDAAAVHRSIWHFCQSIFRSRLCQETKPISSNGTVAGRAHNRRVDIVILDQQVVVQQAGQAPDPKKAAH